MEEKDKLTDSRGSGVEPIPEPDSRQAAREGSTGMIEDAVEEMMDNIEENLTGRRNTGANSGGKSAE